MSAVTLDYRPPGEALRDYVSLFYDFRTDIVFDDVERADLAQVRFQLVGTPGSYVFADGHEVPAPAIQLLGPTTGPTRTRVNGPANVFGWGLRPAGWAEFVGMDASLLVNRVIDARDVFGPVLDRLAEALRAAEGIDARVEIATFAATRLRHERVVRAPEFTQRVDAWLQSAPSPDVDELVRASGMTRRQVERNCKRFYGAPPKVLARKYRALRAAIALAKGEANADALLAEGFYDQSHLIREVKAFTGVTPRQFAEDLPTLAQLTMKRTEFEGLDPLVTGT